MTGLGLVDLRLAAARLEAADGGIRQEVLFAAGWVVRVVRVEAARFEHVAMAPLLAMVLSGVGTLVVEDWRATVLPGQLVSVAEGQRVALVGDGAGAFVGALLEMERADRSDQADRIEGEASTGGPVDVT